MAVLIIGKKNGSLEFENARLVPSQTQGVLPDGSIFFTITKPVTTLGRSESQVDICLLHHTVSRVHALIYQQDDDCYIEDRQSRNGVMVNGQRLPRSGIQKLEEGDRITITGFAFEFSYRHIL